MVDSKRKPLLASRRMHHQGFASSDVLNDPFPELFSYTRSAVPHIHAGRDFQQPACELSTEPRRARCHDHDDHQSGPSAASGAFP